MKTIAVLTVLLCAAAFCGCTGEDGDLSTRVAVEQKGTDDPEPDVLEWNAETEQRIKQDFAERWPTMSDGLEDYYGIYNGCVAVWMNGFDTTREVSKIYIAGTQLPYVNGHEIIIWKQGGHLGRGPFFPLSTAYYLSLLTQGDVKSIAERYWGRPLDNWPEFDPLLLRIFGEGTIRQIIQDYEGQFNDGRPYNTIWIERIYRSSSACTAVMMDGPFHYTGVIEEMIVAGLSVRYPGGNRILIWKPGNTSESGYFYEPQEAYEAGIMTQVDVSRLFGSSSSNRGQVGGWFGF